MLHQKTPLISPVPGTQRYIDSFHFGPSDSGKKAYIQSSLHADELPGMLVNWKLKQQLKELEAQGLLTGEVVLVPVANPLGQAQQVMDVHLGRYDFETGQNYNRGYLDVYPTVKERIGDQLTDDAEANKPLIRQAIKQAVSEWPVESELHSMQKTLQQLCCDADVMLDLHCDFEATLHTYSTFYSWPAIEPLARLMGSPLNMLADETGGSPFDSCTDMVWQRLNREFGERVPQGCIGATIELRGQADVDDSLANQDATAILHYLSTLGIINKAFGELPAQPAPSSDFRAVEMLCTPKGGLLVLKAKLGEWVEAGDVFAEVIDPILDQVEVVRANQSGYVYSRSLRRMATAGMIIGNIAGKNIVRSGSLLAP